MEILSLELLVSRCPVLLSWPSHAHTSPEMQKFCTHHKWGTYGWCPCPSEGSSGPVLELTHEPGLLEDGVSQLVCSRQKTLLGKAHILVSLGVLSILKMGWETWC